MPTFLKGSPCVWGSVLLSEVCVCAGALCGLDCLIWPGRSSASGITVLFITRASHFSPLSKWAPCTRLGSSCYVFVCVYSTEVCSVITVIA